MSLVFGHFPLTPPGPLSPLWRGGQGRGGKQVRVRAGTWIVPLANASGFLSCLPPSPLWQRGGGGEGSYHAYSCVTVALPSLNVGWYISSVLPPDLRSQVVPVPSSFTR